MSLTADEVRALLLQGFPPGHEWLDVRNSASSVSSFLDVLSAAYKAHGFDQVDTAVREFLPSTAIQKLPDWEGALGISETPAATGGTTAARQRQVVAKLREWGASNLPNIRSAVQAFVEYADPADISVMECSRADLTTAHTYTFPAGVIPAAGSYSQSITIRDTARVSKAGAFVWVNITHTTIEDLSIVFYIGGAPYTVVATGALGSGSVTNAQYLFAVTDAYNSLFTSGARLDVINAGANAGNVNSAGANKTAVFVEGIGRDGPVGAVPGNDGLGAAQFEWGVFVDPTKTTVSEPDYTAILRTIQRMNPAHCIGTVIRGSGSVSAGSPYAIPDDVNCIPNQVIPQ